MTDEQLNKVKIRGHLYEIQVKLWEIKTDSRYKRWSPVAKEALIILEDMLDHIRTELDEGTGVVFELVTYRQTTLGGMLFEVKDRMTPQEVHEDPNRANGNGDYILD